jgi:NOL1/NOP2/fmu family ribosome biogenesis protein
LAKIDEEFLKNYGWGSANLSREITHLKISANDSVVEFANGSWIKVVTASDNARGHRANLLILDEFRMIDKNTIDTVLDKFLTTTGQPGYITKKAYKNMLEPNRTIYMSSAWFKDSWAFERAKSYAKAFFNYKRKYFICGLPYQVSIKERLLMRDKVESDMAEDDFDEMSFTMEMESLWYGDAEGAFFSFKDVSARRKLKNAMYPPYMITNKSYKIPELVINERRILSVDVALMATKKHANDATAIVINVAIPTNNNSYTSNIKEVKDNFKSIHQELKINEGYIYKVNDTFYYLNKFIDTKGLHIIRGGLKLGVEEKYGFVYDHAISRVYPINPVELTLEEAKSYLEGNQIIKNSKDGFVTLTYQNNGIGLGKSSKNKINNKYPKGLRIKI